MPIRSSVALLTLPLLLIALNTQTARTDTHTERREKPKTTEATIEPDRAADNTAREAPSGFVQQVIELTNRERLKAGLPALKRQNSLESSAMWLARDMATRHYFDHRDSGSRGLSERITDFKYGGYCALGENIAMGQRTPQEVVDGWMHSPGHRANILSTDFAEIGVGYVPSGPYGAAGYWVQDFGSRFDKCPVVINTDLPKAASSRVRLSIHGEDGITQMRFSNDGVTWTAWENFRPLRDWSLDPGAGRRTVFIEVRGPEHRERIEASVLVEERPEVALARH